MSIIINDIASTCNKFAASFQHIDLIFMVTTKIMRCVGATVLGRPHNTQNAENHCKFEYARATEDGRPYNMLVPFIYRHVN